MTPPDDGAPTGLVTLVFTDVQGSTELWERAPEAMREGLKVHDEVMRAALAAHGGYEVKTEGDAFMIAFPRAAGAVASMLEAQVRLLAAAWPEELLRLPSAEPRDPGEGGPHRGLRVRMGAHLGEPECRRDPITGRMDYFGPMVNRAARVGGAGHGGQVVLSAGTWAAACSGGERFEATPRELGRFRFKGLDAPEEIVELRPAELRARVFPPLRAPRADAPVDRLPGARTKLLGRTTERASLREALTGPRRLVTLLGPGGIGKTTLALEVAREHPNRAIFAELTEATEARGVNRLVAAALDASLCGCGSDAEEAALVARRIADQGEVLLLLDNCEQATEAVAGLVPGWLSEAPGLRILATSREALQLASEQVLPLGSLPGDAAVDLFMARAEAHAPGAIEAAYELPDVVRLCAHLEGMPLAIELAAARTGALAPAEILARLEEGIDLLKTTQRDVPPRQRSLRAALEWSYQLLAPREQRALGQLATFHGGFGAAAAEAVLARAGLSDGLDLLEALRRRSLLRRAGAPGSARLDLYVAVREFALEKLDAAGMRAEAEDHHARYWFERARTFSGDDQQCTRANAPEVRAMRADSENFLAARTTLLESDPASAARLTLALEPWTAGRASAAQRARLRDEAVDAARGAEAWRTLAQLLATRAMTRWLDGDIPGACRDADETVALSPRHGDPVVEGYAYSTRGVVLLFVDARRAEAQADFARAKELEAAHSDAGLRAYTWIDEGAICQHTGRPEGARDAFRQAVEAYRSIGATRLEGLPLTFLGGAYADLGEVEAARACLGRALRIQEACGDLQDGSMAACLLGNLEAGEGRWAEARRLGGQALGQAEAAGITSAAMDARLLLLTAALGEGDGDLADQVLPPLLEATRRVHNQQAEARALWHRAVLRAERGDPTAAADVEAAVQLVALDDPAGGAWAALRHGVDRPEAAVEVPAGARGHRAVRRILTRLGVPLTP